MSTTVIPALPKVLAVLTALQETLEQVGNALNAIDSQSFEFEYRGECYTVRYNSQSCFRRPYETARAIKICYSTPDMR